LVVGVGAGTTVSVGVTVGVGEGGGKVGVGVLVGGGEVAVEVETTVGAPPTEVAVGPAWLQAAKKMMLLNKGIHKYFWIMVFVSSIYGNHFCPSV
jgi:hypothetical protein